MNIFRRWFSHKEKPDTDDSQNPWAGLASYEDPDTAKRKLKFCGRDDESYDVAKLIMGNVFVTLYGKSGIGKTSLLNAGVFPELREERFTPFSLRLGMRDMVSPKTYQSMIVEAIERTVSHLETINVIKEQTDEQAIDYLWNYFARHRFYDKTNEYTTPIIVFDQFEEVFRSDRKEAEMLLRQLDFINDKDHVLDNTIVDGHPYQYERNFRFVVSIREDELCRLEDCIDNNYLSGLKRCRYRLRGLSEKGAAEAILTPGENCIDEEANKVIIDRIISLAKQNVDDEIDTLLLSLICASTFVKKMDEKITMADLSKIWKDNKGEWIKNIMEVYYHDAVKGLDDNKVRYIQQKLIYADGTRKIVDSKELKKALGSDYQRLIEGKSQIMHNVGQNQVELLHDQLGIAVYEERKFFESKRKRNILLFFSVTALIIAGIFIFQNYRLKQQRWKMLENKARFIAKTASDLIEKGDSYSAQRLLLEVLPINLNSHKIPYTSEAEAALREAISHNTAILQGHVGELSRLAISPDGKQIVTASTDKTLRIWDFYSGVCVDTLTEHKDFVLSVLWSHDGSKIISSSADGTVRIWDAKTHQCLDTLAENARVRGIAISLDGEKIATVSGRKNIRIWNTSTGFCSDTLIGHSDAIQAVAFTPDSRYLVSASSDKTIRIWDIDSKMCIDTLIGHKNAVLDCAISPNGDFIASSSADNTIRIWSLTSGSCLKTLIEHKDKIPSVRFSIGGDSIISASYDNTVKLWETSSGACIKTFEGHSSRCNDAIFHPNGNCIISVSSDRSIRIWDITNDAASKTIVFPYRKNYPKETSNSSFDDWINSAYDALDQFDNYPLVAKYNLKGDCIVATSNTSGTIQIYDTALEGWQDPINGHNSGVTAICFCPSLNVMASASRDGTIKIWNQTNWKCVRTLTGHSSKVMTIAFSPNGEYLASGSDDKTVRVWDTQSWSCIDTLTGHNDLIRSVAFNHSSDKLASASLDKTIMIWSIKTGLCLDTIRDHTGWCTCVEYSQDGKYFASSSEDKTIRIWEAKSMKCLQILQGHKKNISTISFSSDGNYLVSASVDNSIMVWHVQTGKCILNLEGHSKTIRSVYFSHDNKKILSCSEDNTIRIWNFPPLQDLIVQTHERFENRSLTPEERRMYYLDL